MPVQKLKTFLDENDVRYVTVNHSRAFTSQEIAASAHIPGRELAKSVIIKIDGQFSMAVLPASYQVDLDHLADAVGAGEIELATEREFKDMFPDCEIGAMPPFGNLYGMEVFVARSLTRDEFIAFNAGSHTELIKMSFADYQRLVQPRIFSFSMVVV